ncbi:MAG TPA: MTH1187 family thiamine-binding protein [Candidatus Dormibacteraeota bacterium]|nr:MTH1187 family thiamine-binding protein [Candidatus Dormibacteraeota bacterium]
MLMELSVVPLGRGPSVGADIADLMKIIDASGLDYQLTAAGTNVEGNWEQLIDLARKCHNEIRKKTARVVTTIKIDDYAERTGRLAAMVKSVENKVGKPLKK